jgi:hypothetical protein
VAIKILDIAINKGGFRFTDFSGRSPARFNLEEMTVKIENMYFATGDKDLNHFTFSANMPDGGEVQMSGQYSIDPMHVDAEIAADRIKASNFSEFIENIIPVKVSNGILSFSTRMLAKMETGFQLALKQGKLSLTDLAMDDDVIDPPMLRVGSITATDMELNLPEQRVIAGSVILDRITADQWLDKTGKPRYVSLMAGNAEEKDQQAVIPRTQEKPPRRNWDILVKQIELKNSTLNFSDKKDEISRIHSMTGITLDLENVTLAPESRTNMQFAALLDEQGRINADGTLSLSPFSMKLNYKIGEIQLPAFSEYLETAAFLRIDKGSLSVEGSATLKAEDKMAVNAALDMSVNGFKAKDTRTGNSLISLKAFRLDDILVDTNSQKISMASAGMEEPEVFVEMSQDKKLNLTSLKKPGKASPETDPGMKSGSDSEWAYSMGKIELRNGNIHFTDKGVEPSFQTGLNNLELAVGRIAKDRPEPTPFSLACKIDQYAPFTVNGTLDPIDKQPGFSLKSELKGLEMPGLSAYSAIYIGNKLRSGQLSLALDYSLHSRKLTGENNIVAKNLYLGEKVPSEKAINAPVGLGLALLRDVNGIIDLDVGLSGDLDDPEFSISGVILKILVNIIVKAAASPFKLLASLAGGTEDIGEINFLDGRADLDQENQARLKHLVDALAERPQLSVIIKGNAADENDSPALRAQRVQELLAASRKISATELIEDAGDQALWAVHENRGALNRMNKELKLTSASDRELKMREENPKLADEALEDEVYRQIYEDVATAQVIGADDLISLADRRAFSIKQHLVDVLKFDHQRVSMSKPQESDLTGSLIKLELGAL